MTTAAKDKLINDYDSLDFHIGDTFIKYCFVYNGVNVNVYFDAYDKQDVSLSLILIFNNNYYYTSLNADDTPSCVEYLHKIPDEILKLILVDNSLSDFYKALEDHILNNAPSIGRYSKDIIFENTMKYSKERYDLPFWKGLRHVRMSDKTLKRLSVTSNIKYDTLKEIQSKNMTLVKTRFPEERKNIRIILKEVDIEL